MFLGEKQCGTVKGRMVYNGEPTREWLSREDSASPTAALKSIMLTAVIDAHEERSVMTYDIPNAFIQALMPEVKDGDERVMMPPRVPRNVHVDTHNGLTDPLTEQNNRSQWQI
jgi:hypothetical protein